MFHILFSVLLNLLFGVALSMLVIRMPEKASILIIGTLILDALISVLILFSVKKEKIKKAKKALKEGEVHHLLCGCTALEAGGNGTLALVRSNKTKKLKLLIFDKEPPPIFKMEEGEIVPYE